MNEPPNSPYLSFTPDNSFVLFASGALEVADSCSADVDVVEVKPDQIEL